MHAIVLSFDQQIGFAELVYKKYMKLWPECPFTFRVPFNNPKTALVPYFQAQNNVELIRTPPDIRRTMFNLLKNIPDEEWVYWCIDDRYPMSIKKSEINQVCQLVPNLPKQINRVKLFRWKENLRGEYKVGGVTFFKQNRGDVWGFWHHSFVRASVLKAAFLTKSIPPKYKIKHVNVALAKDPKVASGSLSNTIVTTDNLITFGEPCVQGCLTQNGVKELQRYNCLMPKYKIVGYAKSFVNKDARARHPFRKD